MPTPKPPPKVDEDLRRMTLADMYDTGIPRTPQLEAQRSRVVQRAAARLAARANARRKPKR